MDPGPRVRVAMEIGLKPVSFTLRTDIGCEFSTYVSSHASLDLSHGSLDCFSVIWNLFAPIDQIQGTVCRR